MDRRARWLLQPCDRLAQRAPGKNVIKAKRLHGVEQHDVQIASDPAVLKGVVQEDELAIQLFHGRTSCSHPIGILPLRHVGQLLFQFQRLVVFRTGLGPIAPADHGYSKAPTAKPSGEPLDHRRLAGSAQGEIADAYHRYVDAISLCGTRVVSPVPPTDRPSVGHFRQPQPETQPGGRDSAASATHQVSKFRRLEQWFPFQRLAADFDRS